MGFDEHAGDAHGHGRARQHRHHARGRRPSDAPCPPGCCTECVASKITGAPVSAMIGSARMSDTSVL